LHQSRDLLHQIINESAFNQSEGTSAAVLALVYNKKPPKTTSPLEHTSDDSSEPASFHVECALGQDQLDKLFKLKRLEGKVVKSFLMNCGD
jgi:hypothetical protein